MKKFALLLLILCLCSVLPITTVTASENYKFMRVIDDTTPFFADENQSELLFYLPYTYYVKVISVENELAHVECQVGDSKPIIDGYTPIDRLYDDSLNVISPYPQITLTTQNVATFYSDNELSTAIQYIFKDRTLTYYGSIYSEESGILLYVSYNGRLGYVKEDSVYPFSIENHPNPLTFLPSENPNDNKFPENVNGVNDFFSLKITLIVCLGFAGIIAVFIAFNKNGKKQHKNTPNIRYYDENDYE